MTNDKNLALYKPLECPFDLAAFPAPPFSAGECSKTFWPMAELARRVIEAMEEKKHDDLNQTT